MKQWTYFSIAIISIHILTACGGRFHAYSPNEANSQPTEASENAGAIKSPSGVTYTQGPGTVTPPSPGTTNPGQPNSPSPGSPDSSSGNAPTPNPYNPTPNEPPNHAGDNVSKLTCAEAQFVRLLNIYRGKNGRSSLTVSLAGVKASRWHAQDMINKNYFSHTEPNGRSFTSRAGAFGYSAWAENIAAGSHSAEGSFCQWKNSPGHNTNMLSAQHSSMGIGNVSGGGGYGTYWSNNFGPQVSDAIQEPLTNDSNCPMPSSLPGC